MKKIIELKKGDTAYKIDCLHYIHKINVKDVEDIKLRDGSSSMMLKITFSDDWTFHLRIDDNVEHKPYVQKNNSSSLPIYTTTLAKAREIVSLYFDEKIAGIDKEIENLKKERETWINLKRKKLRL